ncbi:unnamed protein product, partial [Mesorhabditis belari]|uniref:KATNIP domain-containing protein n=1 Tax=Mesorhabditis belari TaxID=2138241 RepID=A0AAF3J5V8_9BILA
MESGESEELLMQQNGSRIEEEIAFEIPVLPNGKELCLHLEENWGDLMWIGLNCVEIFTNQGTRATVDKISTSSLGTQLGNMNCVLVENFGCTDGAQMWCASVEEAPIDLRLQFSKEETIAMIRIWNYNESRVHAQRGVRRLKIFLDQALIFKGEIKCAYESEEEVEGMGDTVLFTTDESILEAIAHNDLCLIHDFDFATSTMDVRTQNEITETSMVQFTPYRPTTGELLETSRETTKISSNQEKLSTMASTTISQIKAKVLHIELLSNWGSPDSIGLTGIEILGSNSEAIDLSDAQISVINGEAGVDRLVNGRNLTRLRSEMWLSAFDGNHPPTITLNFTQPQTIAGISFWNYNASPELSYAGVREARIHVNSKLVVGSALLRKAPGFVFFDFVQDVPFTRFLSTRSAIQRPLTHSIDGFIFQLRLLSTWGDEFYIGLNGIELRDRKDRSFKLKPHNLAAFPESINILPMVEGDPRTSDNLINGQNDMDRPENMWLTPLLPNRCARIFFIFDEPTFVSKIVIYNYRKTPERGVRHISVSVDDLIVFSGEVPASSQSQTGILEVGMRED